MKENTNKLPFLSWIIIPILGVWFATSYLVGVVQQPEWIANPKDSMQVVAQERPEINFPKINYTGGPLLTFWLDDAWDSQYSVAFPILKSKNFPAAIAVPTNVLGWEDYMTEAQLRRLSYNGWEITAHSRSHLCDKTKMTTEVLEDELGGSKIDLKNMGYIVDIYVPPCGVITEPMVDLATKHYLAFRTSEFGLNPIPIEDPYNLLVREIRETTALAEINEYLEEARQTESWIILLLHKFNDTGGEFSIKPDLFKSIVETVEKSKIPVVLPSQVLNLELN